MESKKNKKFFSFGKSKKSPKQKEVKEDKTERAKEKITKIFNYYAGAQDFVDEVGLDLSLDALNSNKNDDLFGTISNIDLYVVK